MKELRNQLDALTRAFLVRFFESEITTGTDDLKRSFFWLLAALGVYVRDVKLIIVVAAPVVMFLSPIFFPLSAVPERFQKIFYANPLTFALEGARSALFAGHWVSPAGLVLYCAASFLFAWIAFRVFSYLRPGFADVL